MVPKSSVEMLAHWRGRFGIGGAPEDAMAPAIDHLARCEVAESKMRKTAEAQGLRAKGRITSIKRDARRALKWLANADPADAPPPALAALEVVVAFDGSRPSYPMNNGEIDFGGGLDASRWATSLRDLANNITSFAACVGRVELGGKAIGTASLIAPNLALTNRHVLQEIASATPEGWVVRPGATLDFGREERATGNFDPRAIKAVVWCGAHSIPPDGPVDHSRLDLALIEVERSRLAGLIADRALCWGALAADDVPDRKPAVAVIGYPGAPGERHVPPQVFRLYADLLRQLLGSGGTKRIAPGYAFAVPGPPAWTLAHSATTIAGSSGSPLMVISHGLVQDNATAAALHHGGVWAEDGRRNFAHVLAATLAATDAGGKPLCEVLAANGVKVVEPQEP